MRWSWLNILLYFGHNQACHTIPIWTIGKTYHSYGYQNAVSCLDLFVRCYSLKNSVLWLVKTFLGSLTECYKNICTFISKKKNINEWFWSWKLILDHFFFNFLGCPNLLGIFFRKLDPSLFLLYKRILFTFLTVTSCKNIKKKLMSQC